jgi:hypothetical protein
MLVINLGAKPPSPSACENSRSPAVGDPIPFPPRNLVDCGAGDDLGRVLAGQRRVESLGGDLDGRSVGRSVGDGPAQAGKFDVSGRCR